MSPRDAAAPRPTHPEPVRATRRRRDDSPYGQQHAGFPLPATWSTHRGLPSEKRMR
jgi:hypothetical protein